jgi:hypoxanthine phosphoribosyltransferase
MKKLKRVGDLTFAPYISAEEIKLKVKELAILIRKDYKGKNPVFIVVMNGAFVFAADLLRKVKISCDIKFVQVKSYVGIDSTGEVAINWPPETNLQGRHVIIIEDIIDTGVTLHQLIPNIESMQPKSTAITAIFVKPEAHKHQIDIQYPGIEIPKEFIVGYGLDYNGMGRNLKDVYQSVSTDHHQSENLPS